MSQFDSSHFENYIVAMERGYIAAQKVIPLLKEKLEKAMSEPITPGFRGHRRQGDRQYRSPPILAQSRD